MFNPPYTGNAELDAFLAQLVLEGTGSTGSGSGNVTTDTGTGLITDSSNNILGYLYQYMHIKYADDNVGTNISNSPTGKLYYGLNNDTFASESVNPADYTWYEVIGGFGSLNKLWYICTGGRQIRFAVATAAPDTGWLIDPGSSIDLDVVTSGNIPVIAETFTSYFTPANLQVPRTGNPLAPVFTNIVPTLYATNGGSVVPFVDAQTDSAAGFVANTWRIGNSSTTGYGDISKTNLTVGDPTDGGDFAVWPNPTAMPNSPAYITVPIRFKDSLGNVSQASVATLQLLYGDPGPTGNSGNNGSSIDISGYASFAQNAGGAFTPANATLSALLVNVTSPSYSWAITGATPTSSTASSVVVTPTSSSTGVTVTLTVNGSNLSSPLTKSISMPVVYDGAAGQAGANGRMSAFPTIYIWTGSSTPPTRPSTSSTYTWSSGNYTAPTGWSTTAPSNTTPGNYLWSITIPLNVVATTTTSALSWPSTSNPIRAVSYNGTNGADGTNGTNGSNGINGTRTAILDVYKWSAATPTTFPSGTSTYTWATGQFTAPATLNGWSLTPPSPVAGQTLYISRQLYADSNTTATSPVTWSTTSANPFTVAGVDGTDGTDGANGANGTRTAIIEMYKWDLVTPTTFPSGTSTYTWSDGSFTLPATTNGWSLTPGTPDPGYTLFACSVSYADTNTTSTSPITWSTNTAYPVGFAGNDGNSGSNGINGTRTAILEMYQWSVSAPTTFPSGSSTYTWATGQFTAPATTNSWSLSPPTAVLGQTLWVCRTIYADTNVSATTPVTWSATAAYPAGASGTSGSNGANGVNGTRTAFLELYLWSSSVPTNFPSGSSTYTWSNGTFTLPPTANSWSLTPGTPSAGQTLYGCSVSYADNNTSTTSSVTWNTSVAYALGAAGTNGANGSNGLNGTRTAILEMYKVSATVPATFPAGTSTYTWSTGQFTDPATLNGWSQTPPAPIAGQTLYTVRQAYADSNSTLTTPITWSATTSTATVTSGNNGTDGVNGYRTAVIEVYKWSATTPTTFPSGTSVYTWSNGTFTNPATLNGWALTPGTAVPGQALYGCEVIFADNTTTATSTITWNTSTAYPLGYAGTDGTNGLNGTRTAILEMYRVAATAPTTFPAGTSTYTWSTGQFTAPATLNGWSLTPPAPVVGQTLYTVRQTYADSNNTATSSVTWSATTSTATVASGANGSAGTNGNRTAVIEVYKWSATVPNTFPSGDSTYTWATGQFTNPPTLNGWALTPGTAVQGQTLYGCETIYSDNLTTATTNITWNTSTPYPIGYAGANGAAGTNGSNGLNGTRTAILDVYQWASSTPITFPTGTSTYTWATAQFTNPTNLNGWSLTPPAPVAGQTMYVARQLYSDSNTTSTSTVTWSVSTANPFTVAGTNGANGANGSDGTDGSNGYRTAYLELYKWGPSAPTTFPSGNSTYTWADGSFTAPSTLNGWSLTPGSSSPGYFLYACSVRYADTGTSPTSTVAWNTSTPYIIGAAGATGATGSQGQGGAATFVVTRTANDSSAPTNTEVSGVLGRNPVAGDICTVSYNNYNNATVYKYTTSWTLFQTYITGSLIVQNTITGDKIAANTVTSTNIDSRNLSIKDSSGNVIFAAGTKLDTPYIVVGAATSANASGTTSTIVYPSPTSYNGVTIDGTTLSLTTSGGPYVIVTLTGSIEANVKQDAWNNFRGFVGVTIDGGSPNTFNYSLPLLVDYPTTTNRVGTNSFSISLRITGLSATSHTFRPYINLIGSNGVTGVNAGTNWPTGSYVALYASLIVMENKL